MNDDINVRLMWMERRRQRVVLHVHPEVVGSWLKASVKKMITGRMGRSVVTFFEVVNQVTGHRGAMMITAGLGLGIGLSVIVGQRPSLTYAEPQRVVTEVTGPEMIKLKLGVTGVEVFIKPESEVTLLAAGRVVYHQSSSARPTENGVMFVHDPHGTLATELASLNLGDQIKIQASHQGWYTYTVVEMRASTLDALSALDVSTQETVVLSSRVSRLNDQVIAIIARPYSL